MKTPLKTPGMLTILAVVGLAFGETRARAVAACDRECLKRLMDSYLAAVVAHDPKHAPIAPTGKLVENLTPMKPGEGLWKTASAAPTTFKIYVPDPTSQQVGFVGLMEEDGKPVEVAVRLRLENGRITEMEHLVARNLTDRNLGNLKTPRPGLVRALAPAERSRRADLIRIGASYYDALDDNDGARSPLADDCVRHENGMQTTGNSPPATPGGFGTLGSLGCTAQINTGTFAYIDTIDHRRVTIADVETGLVFGLSHFHHSMTQKFVVIKGVPGVEKVDLNINAFDFPAAHIYKVSGGRIHEIEALGVSMPYQSKTGWE
jgi:hypothetical protein